MYANVLVLLRTRSSRCGIVMDSKKINITFRRTQGVMPKYNHVHTARGVGFAEQPPHLPHQVQVTTHKYIRTTHSFRNCRHPFINASGCLNPELGQRGDDDAYRRWQARMTSHRRDGTSSRAHTKKNRRNRSGQTRGFHQDQDQVNSHSGNPVTNTRLTTMVVSHPRPLLLPRSLPEFA